MFWKTTRNDVVGLVVIALPQKPLVGQLARLSVWPLRSLVRRAAKGGGDRLRVTADIGSRDVGVLISVGCGVLKGDLSLLLFGGGLEGGKLRHSLIETRL
jgi:hypothetical protein